MMTGITGTPGTGKSTVGRVLSACGYPVTEIADTIGGYILERDEVRDTFVIDEERWIAEFPHVEGFVVGHLAHLLPCDLVVVLRCEPHVLEERLRTRRYKESKIRENCEAEALDVILIETLEIHPAERVLEIDTTHTDPMTCAERIELFVKGEISPSLENIDWSEYLGEEM